MELHLLRRTACLAIYHDFRNDWLYLDWQGHVTLPVLQEACLALADCFLHRPYPRVLNNNEQVTGVHWGIAMWLVTDFLPYMTLAGVQQVAWVFSPSLQGRSMVQVVLSWLPGQALTAFDDLASAVEWLAHTRAEPAPGYLLPRRTAADQARLEEEVLALRQRIAKGQRQAQRA